MAFKSNNIVQEARISGVESTPAILQNQSDWIEKE